MTWEIDRLIDMDPETHTEERELLSVCCGAPEHEYVEGFCSACHEGTAFEEEEA